MHSTAIFLKFVTKFLTERVAKSIILNKSSQHNDQSSLNVVTITKPNRLIVSAVSKFRKYRIKLILELLIIVRKAGLIDMRRTAAEDYGKQAVNDIKRRLSIKNAIKLRYMRFLDAICDLEKQVLYLLQ